MILETLFLFLTRRLSHLEQGCNMKWNNVPEIPLSILPFLVHYKLISRANSSLFISFFFLTFFCCIFFNRFGFLCASKRFFCNNKVPKNENKNFNLLDKIIVSCDFTLVVLFYEL